MDNVIHSHKAELNKVICSNMDGPRDCLTDWSKSEKDKYDIAYIWNLKKKKVEMNMYKTESDRYRR